MQRKVIVNGAYNGSEFPVDTHDRPVVKPTVLVHCN